MEKILVIQSSVAIRLNYIFNILRWIYLSSLHRIWMILQFYLATSISTPLKTLFYKGLILCRIKFEYYFIHGRGVRSSVNTPPPVASLIVHIFVHQNRGDGPPKKIYTKKIENLVFFNCQKKPEKSKKKFLVSFFQEFTFLVLNLL